MSVYKNPKSRFWLYDFVIQRRRFHGSTGQTSRRAAEAAERRLRAQAAEGRLGEAAQLTLDQAAGQWWAEVGQGRADSLDVQRRVGRLIALVGPHTVIADITTAVVSRAIQKRKAISWARSPAKGAARYLPSNATVNRDVIETLRPILLRAARSWGAQGLPQVAWGELRLPEPRERVQTYTGAEQAAWLAECGPAPALALRLLLRYGLRFGELFFALDAFDPAGPRLAIRRRKRDVPHVVPLLAEDAAEIAARAGRAAGAGLAHIWFAEIPSKRPGRPPRLAPLTYYGLQARLNGAADRAGLGGPARIHGARHHAATAILRSSGSLGLARQLLGHADVKSTLRYAHVLEDDLRAALTASAKPVAKRAKRKV